MVFVFSGRKTKSVRPEPTTKRDVQRRYGCRAPRGESKKANKKEDEDMPARARKWVSEMVVRFVKAWEALVAEGRVRRVGRVRVLSVYERPYYSHCQYQQSRLMQLKEWVVNAGIGMGMWSGGVESYG
jgi:hypothetical protein